MCRPNAARSRNTATGSPTRISSGTEEVSADYADMIYAASPAEIEERRRAFLRFRLLVSFAQPDQDNNALLLVVAARPRLAVKTSTVAAI
jgi:hypothetical protein